MTHNPLRSRETVIIPDRPTPSKATKVAAWNKAGGICWWCGKPVAAEGLGVQYDHKRPRELSGDDTLDNLFPMHTSPCHERKTRDEDRPAITKAHRQERLTRAKVKKPSGFRQHPTLYRGLDGQVRERRR